MGGRGSSSAYSKNTSGGAIMIQGSAGDDMLVAGMTAKIDGESYRYTSTDATLQKLESEALSLDHEQLKIVDKNGFVVAAVDGEKHSVGITDNALKYMQGNTVTHNHPAGYGGTFSKADVASLRLGMNEIRASAAEGTYSLKATNAMKNAKPSERLNLAVAYEKAINGSLGRRATNAYNKTAANGGTDCDTLGNWLSKNASKYGYTYTFTANSDFDIKTAGGYNR